MHEQGIMDHENRRRLSLPARLIEALQTIIISVYVKLLFGSDGTLILLPKPKVVWAL
jgi:hypothetical protein